MEIQISTFQFLNCEKYFRSLVGKQLIYMPSEKKATPLLVTIAAVYKTYVLFSFKRYTNEAKFRCEQKVTVHYTDLISGNMKLVEVDDYEF